MTEDIFTNAREFVRREARLLERRLFAALFEGSDPAGVVDALRGYQNQDGGFGNGLEPDKLCPDSLAIDVETALLNLVAAGTSDETMVRRSCDWLESVAAPDGPVSLASPVMEPYPRAEHWSDWTYAPGLNPTAGLAGVLYQLGVDHPWLTRATEWCRTTLEGGFPDDAHAMSESLIFLEHAPGTVGDDVVGRVAGWLPKLAHYRADASDPSYGVTPLHLAPTPDAFWRRLFDDAVIEGHLDRLERDQQPDGGWAITWEPPSAAATLAYRGVETVRALRVLRAYGRL